MSKRHIISLALLAFILTACGQKGALYFPETQLPEKNASEIPTQTADNPTHADNPTDLNKVKSPTTIDPAINPNSENPNIKNATLQGNPNAY